MKKLILISLLLLVGGCSSISETYLLSKFDPIEYQRIVKIRFDAKEHIDDCSNPQVSRENAKAILKEIEFLEMYDDPIANNTDIQKSLTELHKVATGLVTQYTKSDNVSIAFCTIKFKTIEADAYLIQAVMGNKPK